MLDHIAVRPDVRAHDAPADYISSFRANAACAGELVRLYDEIDESLADARVSADAADAKVAAEEPVVRRSPARCLVQLGPVALTVAWLQRSQGTVADGELLVVVWRGEVAVRTPQGFERAHQHSGASSATALWETVLVASAQSETQWGWVPAAGEGNAESSADLARRCVERLRAAHAECAQ
jgi:hypothetical protein